MTDAFTCSKCGVTKAVQTSGGTGYATDDEGAKICYACCADIDREAMVKDGKTVLYLTVDTQRHGLFYKQTRGRVSNWPGTLSFAAHVSKGRHNIARTRYDVWFKGPGGFMWHGVQYGENTQLCHCKRTKRAA